jgi:hypothetical protein
MEIVFIARLDFLEPDQPVFAVTAYETWLCDWATN